MALSSRLLLAAGGLRAAGKAGARRAGPSRRRLRGPRAPGAVRRPGDLAVPRMKCLYLVILSLVPCVFRSRCFVKL